MRRDIETHELQPCDVLVIDRVPTLDDYLDEWFAHCERESIDFAPPRVKVSHEVASLELTFWFPELGLCKIGTPKPCWELKEPFASQGHYTDCIHFWELELLTPRALVPVEFQKVMAARYPHQFSNGVPCELQIVGWYGYDDMEIPEFVSQQEQLQVPHEVIGTLCVFGREISRSYYYGSGKRSLARHSCRGEWSKEHYLLSHTIMTQVTGVLANDRTMRVVERYRPRTSCPENSERGSNLF